MCVIEIVFHYQLNFCQQWSTELSIVPVDNGRLSTLMILHLISVSVLLGIFHIIINWVDVKSSVHHYSEDFVLSQCKKVLCDTLVLSSSSLK